jgi:hypothetical protein
VVGSTRSIVEQGWGGRFVFGCYCEGWGDGIAVWRVLGGLGVDAGMAWLVYARFLWW